MTVAAWKLEAVASHTSRSLYMRMPLFMIASVCGDKLFVVEVCFGFLAVAVKLVTKFVVLAGLTTTFKAIIA